MPTKDQSLYRHVIRDALRLAFKRRQLWLFGFFAMFLSTGGLVDTLIRSLNHLSSAQIERLHPELAPRLPEIFAALAPRDLLTPPAWLLFGGALILALLGAGLWCAVVSQGALISGIAAVDHKIDPRMAIGRGIASFWTLLIINVISKVTLGVAALLTALPLGDALANNRTGAMVLSFIAFALFIAVALSVNVVSFFALIDASLTRSSVRSALTHGFATFQKHWVVAIETALVIFGADILLAAVYFTGLILLLVPFTVLFLMMIAIGTASGVWFFLSMVGIVLLAWTIVTVSFAATFRYAVWTLLFDRLQGRGVVAKIVRILRSVPETLRHATNLS